MINDANGEIDDIYIKAAKHIQEYVNETGFKSEMEEKDYAEFYLNSSKKLHF